MERESVCVHAREGESKNKSEHANARQRERDRVLVVTCGDEQRLKLFLIEGCARACGVMLRRQRHQGQRQGLHLRGAILTFFAAITITNRLFERTSRPPTLIVYK